MPESLPADNQNVRYMATCPKGLEHVLAKELVELGAEQVQESIAACYFSASLACAYTVCLWSRVANRIVWQLLRSTVASTDDLFRQVADLLWSDCFSAEQTLQVDFNGSNHFIRDARFGHQLVKDAINEHFQHRGYERLRVDLEQPDIVIYVRLYKNKLSIGIDMVGESLHRRAYRQGGGDAPLKENLAAAILRLCDWPTKAEAGELFVDPMCGSGTLLIEAALMAAGIAPSYRRKHWQLQRHKNYEPSLWFEKCEQVERGVEGISTTTSRFRGYDREMRAVELARQNILSAGLGDIIQVEQCEVDDLQLPVAGRAGLLVVNPPYGKRLGEVQGLDALYRQLGDLLKRDCLGWDAAIFTGNPDLGWSTGLRSWRQHKLYNGSIPCQLQRYRVEEKNFKERSIGQSQIVSPDALGEAATMLLNRINKNLRKLKPWLKTQPDICYRVYDADLPEYAVAIDCYPAKVIVSESEQDDQSGEGMHCYFHIQEYAAPAHVDQAAAKRRLNEAVSVVSAAFNAQRDRIFLKRRVRQKGRSQYEKMSSQAPDLQVTEGGHAFKVNLGQYLDTGLFLDHRPVRRLIAQSARGKRFLNLFAYTSTATVYAAKGGARSSVSVDMSRTYIQWSRFNFRLNNLPIWQHQLVQADCLQWLQENQQMFDCILLDPPSFSNSSRMQATLDVQRDHQQLIELCMQRLDSSGCLYFSNNRRGFKLDAEVMQRYQVEDIGSKTHDADFDRPRPAHYCWVIRHLVAKM